jgi:CRISPR system Cascade subunit CasB
MNKGSFVSAGREILFTWWRGLEQDKGGRAALRRCHTLTEVVLVPAYHGLYRPLLALPELYWQRDRLPAVAALAAMVEVWESGLPSLPGQMSQKLGERKWVSELRLRRLLQCQEPEELFQALRRVVRLLDHRVDILSLADGVHDWGDRTRKEWAFDYYAS